MKSTSTWLVNHRLAMYRVELFYSVMAHFAPNEKTTQGARITYAKSGSIVLGSKSLSARKCREIGPMACTV